MSWSPGREPAAVNVATPRNRTAHQTHALPIEKAWVANGLLMALFLSEVAKHSLQLYYYQRGM